jgi:hypothetical protein
MEFQGAAMRWVHQFFPCAFFASQKIGLSASIFWLCQKDLRCNPWRDPGASGDFARKKLVHRHAVRIGEPHGGLGNCGECYQITSG